MLSKLDLDFDSLRRLVKLSLDECLGLVDQLRSDCPDDLKSGEFVLYQSELFENFELLSKLLVELVKCKPLPF